MKITESASSNLLLKIGEDRRGIFLGDSQDKKGSKVNDKHLHFCFLFLILYINSLFYVNM